VKYERILAAFYRTPLALLPAKIEEIRHFLHTKAAGGEISAEEVQAIAAARHEPHELYTFWRDRKTGEAVDWSEALGGDVLEAASVSAARRADGTQVVGKVAVLPIMGMISQRVGMLQEASGGVSTERVGASLDGLVRDPAVKAIVLHVDSPGGSVFGVEELASKIRGARDRKKVVGIADSTAASAAYYLLSQASEVNVTPSGQVGSIGVYGAHEDWSGWEQREGIKTTLVYAGDYKVEGSPYGPLSEDAKGEMQRQVNAYYEQFVNSVAKGRGVTAAKVKADFGQGRMALAGEAVDRGMADRVATLDQVLRRLGAFDAPPGASAAAAAAPLSAKLAAVRARALRVGAEQD
jgi:signal peptide peptidase SppA